MEATLKRTRNLRIHLFALSGSRPLSVFFEFLPGILNLVSPVAASAVFSESVTAMALDLSYTT